METSLLMCGSTWARGGAVCRGIVIQAGRSRVRFPVAVWPKPDSASKRYEYQENFLGGKGSRCRGLTNLPPSWGDCLEIWKPQPAETRRTCPVLHRDCFTFMTSVSGVS